MSMFYLQDLEDISNISKQRFNVKYEDFDFYEKIDEIV